MSATRRGKQLTCNCGVYGFPHRLGGGKCDGTIWAEFYYYYISEECEDCNNNNNSICEVMTGQEPITECEAYKMMKIDNSMLIIPYELEEYYSADNYK